MGNFIDDFGYTYRYKIEDAVVKPVNVDEMSENIKMYSAISQSGLLKEIMAVIMETDGNIYYEDYQLETSTLEEVEIQRIEACITELKSINENDYKDLIENLTELKVITEIANANIANGNFEANKDLEDRIDIVFNFINEWISRYEL